MSLDGAPLLISKNIEGEQPITKTLDCGGLIYLSSTGQFSRCTLGHTHCRTCYNVARRFRQGYTCNHREESA